MVVGVCQLALRFHDCRSLKEKRQILKSVIGKVKNRFNISIAEVGGHTFWQKADVGIAVIGTDNAFVNSVIDKVLDYIDGLHLAEIIDHDVEFLKFSPPWATYG